MVRYHGHHGVHFSWLRAEQTVESCRGPGSARETKGYIDTKLVGFKINYPPPKVMRPIPRRSCRDAGGELELLSDMYGWV